MEEIFSHILSGGGGAVLVLVIMWERLRRMQKDLEGLQIKLIQSDKLEESMAKMETNLDNLDNKFSEFKADIKSDIKELFNALKK